MDVCARSIASNLFQMTRFIQLGLLVAALAVVGSILATPQAMAASTVQYGLTDDAWLLNGPGSLESRLARLDQLGVRVVRFSVRWDEVAGTQPTTPTDPADPAYDWGKDDDVLDGLRAHGIAVVLQLVGTPGWANGAQPSNFAPTSGKTFADFAAATAQRYSWIKRWLIWNEPNQARWLRPTSAAIYTTRLLNPAYAAIHAAVSGAQVAGGGTAPRGSTGGVSPVAWIAGMRAAHAKLDAYAHNPYPLDPKRETPLKGGCSYCTTITMATISKLVTLVTRNFPRARIWLTEYGYQTNPPDKLLGVPYALQARYLGEGAYAAYHAPRVDLLIHFLYRDEPNVARFQSGLVTLTNKEKPAFNAFEVPLAQISRSGTRSALWGQLRAPAAGSTARLERRVGSRWQTLATVHGGAAGFFRWTGTLPRGSQVRVHAGALVGAPLAIT
jgi:hypothetical protein